MPTGLLIRDFVKEYRELRYASQGSIRFSEIESNAYRMALTLEITHIDSPRYANLKTLPENTHYGYATLFRGSSVADSVAIKYPKFRVFDIINQGIWNYHQFTENQQLGASTIALTVDTAAKNLWEVLGDGVGNLAQLFLAAYYQSEEGQVPRWVIEIFDDESGVTEPFGNEFEKYRAFPIASPFPDVVKFKADIPCSFLFRLELWYLVNPAVYIADSPTDGDDATDDEPEYPRPDDSGRFPPSSPADADSDPKDFGDEGTQVPPPPFSGGQCEGILYAVTIEIGGDVAPPKNNAVYNVLGPVRGIRQESTVLGGTPARFYYLRHGSPETEVSLGVLFTTLDGLPNNPVCRIVSVSRPDGQPDNCGDPPPIVG